MELKKHTPEKLHQNKPEEVLKLAVKRMLPGGPLGKKQFTKLKFIQRIRSPSFSSKSKSY